MSVVNDNIIRRRLTLGVVVGLDLPQRIGQNSLLVASHLLLLETPLRKLDLVRKQVAASHDVPEPELGSEGPETLARFLVTFIPFVDFDDPIVIRVSRVAGDTVPGDLLLEVDIGDRRADIVRM